MKRPFRVLSVVLLLVVIFEIYGIVNTPTYTAELEEARAAYQTALAEHEALKKEALAGASGWRD